MIIIHAQNNYAEKGLENQESCIG